MTPKTWICERRGRYVATVLVSASSRKEAQEKIAQGEGDTIDTSYYAIGRTRVVRRDQAKKNP